MKTLLVLIALLSADIAWGSDVLFSPQTKGLRLTEFNVEFFQYHARRDSYFPDYPIDHWVGGSKVNYTISLYRAIYFKNTLHFSYDKSPQVREAGWIYEIGVKAFKWLDLYKWHHSRHGMEYVHPDNLRFPVEDTYGVRLNLVH